MLETDMLWMSALIFLPTVFALVILFVGLNLGGVWVWFKKRTRTA